MIKELLPCAIYYLEFTFNWEGEFSWKGKLTSYIPRRH